MSELNCFKELYNHNLERYYKGCNYIMEKPKETDKWLSLLQSILEDMNIYLIEIEKEQEITNDEILNGFKITGGNKENSKI